MGVNTHSGEEDEEQEIIDKGSLVCAKLGLI